MSFVDLNICAVTPFESYENFPRAEPLPLEVRCAQEVDWGVLVDAYLIQAARVGNRFAALVYADQSGVIADGTTIATAPVRVVSKIAGFKLLQTLDERDHYVVVSELSV